MKYLKALNNHNKILIRISRKTRTAKDILDVVNNVESGKFSRVQKILDNIIEVTEALYFSI